MTREWAFVNAVIRTVDDRNTVVDAVLVRDGRIVAVGREEDVRAAAGPGCRIRDLEQRTVVPGFIDPHNHLSLTALDAVSLDCSGKLLPTVDELLHAIAGAAAVAVPGQWIRGTNFTPFAVSEGRAPTIGELDEAARDNPFFLLDVSCNRAWANTRALEVVGINEFSPQPWGGQIERDHAGMPTGSLLQAAMNPLQTASWHAIGSADWDVTIELLSRRMAEYAAVGLTGLSDAAVTPDAAEMYARADRQGTLPFTVHQMHTADDFFGKQDIRRTGFVDRVHDRESNRLRGGTMKIFLDHGFPDGPIMNRVHQGCHSHTGSAYYGKLEVVELAVAANQLGIRTAIHAMGNWAVDVVLDAYESVRRAGGDELLRLEHAYVAEPAQAPRMADLGVDLVAKPGILFGTGPFFDQAWRGGGQAHLRVVPLRSMIDAGVRVSFGSDAPAGPYRPADILWNAVSRMSMTGEVIDADEAVTPEQALRCATINAAYASGRENEVGSIEVGKRANLVIIDRDVVTCAVDEIRGMEVLETIVDGVPIFSVLDHLDIDRLGAADRVSTGMEKPA
ncbi:amidohydrolase [Microbacterium sp. LMC-P-041]|uniref:amidohydrolase n=1 Tax=Microbacterium sp. LMC-P-041 TaxID=3040293 RepID=UPI0025557D7D|nr:amidohydrolase [Microbacterium sp. LMC-P-041]